MSGDSKSENFKHRFTGYFIFFIILILVGGFIIVVLSYFYEIKYQPGICNQEEQTPEEQKIAQANFSKQEIKSYLINMVCLKICF